MVLKNLFTGQQWRNRHREQTYGQAEKGGEGEMYERVTWEFSLPYVKQIANGNLLYVSGNSNRGSVPMQRGGRGREMGRSCKSRGIYVYLWLIHVEVGQKTTKFYKATILQLKINFLKIVFNYATRYFLTRLQSLSSNSQIIISNIEW